MPFSFFAFIFFILGLIVGSFLNCVIYRLEQGESFLRGRSFCPHCKKNLNWFDLIPILSFFILGGKCRYCRKPISWQYPLVEISTGLIFLLISNFLFIPISNLVNFSLDQFLTFIFYLTITSFFIIIFVYDLKHYIIPDRIIYLAILVVGTWYLVSSIFFHFYTKYEILNTIYSAFGATAFFLSVVLISRGRWMGLGDVKLAFLLGLFLGWPKIIVSLFSAFFLGAIIGVGLIIFGKKKLKSEVPFGPFLITGAYLAFLWGEKIINWYLNFLLV